MRWNNDVDTVWHPTVKRHLAGTPFEELDLADLRKAAITFWLESGMTHRMAAELAGHSVEVQLRHYAGVTVGGRERLSWEGIDNALDHVLAP